MYIYGMKSKPAGIFHAKISKEQAKDSGMALVLILLILGLFLKINLFFFLAAGLLLVNMVFPMFFYPYAVVWFGFSAVLGSVTSKIILLVIYVAVVLPVALARRLAGKDSLSLRKFKNGEGSALKSRDHIYQANDLEKPF
jgi:hypothetical protein